MEVLKHRGIRETMTAFASNREIGRWTLAARPFIVYNLYCMQLMSVRNVYMNAVLFES